MAAPSGLSHSPQRPYSLSAKVGSFLLATLPKRLMSTDRHKVRLDTDPLRNPDFASPYLGSPEEDRACAPSLSPSQLDPGDGERRRQWALTTHFEEMPCHTHSCPLRVQGLHCSCQQGQCSSTRKCKCPNWENLLGRRTLTSSDYSLGWQG